MPKLLIFFSIFLSGIASQPQEMSLTEIREGYFYSSFGSDKIESFNQQLLQIENRIPIVIAYDAAAKAILTRTTWNWFKKLDYLQESRKLFEEAVSNDSLNVEIRFLRFTVEDRIPFYLGYSDHMEEDKRIILKHLQNYNIEGIDPEIFQYLHQRLEESGEFSEQELSSLKKKFSKLH